MKRICLFLNGAFEFSSFKIEFNNEVLSPLHHLKKLSVNTEYYAADGGLNHILKHKFLTPNLKWVGDSDSLNTRSKNFLKKHPVNTVHLNKEKDLSDLASILDTLGEQIKNDNFFIEIYGGLGKRRDHEEANINEIKRFLSLFPQTGTVFFHGGIVITSHAIKFIKIDWQLFSIFAPKGLVDVEGAQYSGRFSLQRPSHGLSNSIVEKVLTIAPIENIVSLYFSN